MWEYGDIESIDEDPALPVLGKLVVGSDEYQKKLQSYVFNLLHEKEHCSKQLSSFQLQTLEEIETRCVGGCKIYVFRFLIFLI